MQQLFILFFILYVHSLMSYKDLCETINPYVKSKISEDQTNKPCLLYNELVK